MTTRKKWIGVLLTGLFLTAAPVCRGQNWYSHPTGHDAARDSVLVSVLDTLHIAPMAALSQGEAAYLALRLGKKEALKTLEGKNFCFLRTDQQTDKSAFFKTEKDRLKRLRTTPGYFMVFFFDETEKDLCGGYDGAIVLTPPRLYQNSFILKQIMRLNRNRGLPAD